MAWGNGVEKRTGLRRVLTLMKRLEGHRYCPPIAELAAELSVHKRTIRRDLHLLEDCGWLVPKFRFNERATDWEERE